jgi:hypothetical protein
MSSSEFATTIEQLAHWAFVRLLVDFIQNEAIHAFISGVRDQELKYHLLLGSSRSLRALNGPCIRSVSLRQQLEHQ